MKRQEYDGAMQSANAHSLAFIQDYSYAITYHSGTVQSQSQQAIQS